ncbi:unnamed protein product [Gadus morhua 'NCC']
MPGAVSRVTRDALFSLSHSPLMRLHGVSVKRPPGCMLPEGEEEERGWRWRRLGGGGGGGGGIGDRGSYGNRGRLRTRDSEQRGDGRKGSITICMPVAGEPGRGRRAGSTGGLNT